jgi:Protein of unknown function (DUF3365)
LVLQAGNEFIYRKNLMKKYSTSFAIICASLVSLCAVGQEMALTESSRSVAIALMQQLGAALKKEIAAGGPDAAINACTKIAPELATKYSIENGWRVTRVSLKVRNPLLGTADSWEQLALKEFDVRAATGDAVDKLEFAEIVSEPSGQYFRYVKALPVQPLCLACHGSAEQIADSVKRSLAQNYPHDLATGYALGQVRGAISIKRPVK